MRRSEKDGISFLSLGFRPFFLGASVFAVISMLAWMGVYIFRRPISVAPLSISQWHAHEMIYGYALAVIAGFLLTAVRNWTGIPTPQGVKLGALFLLWLAARILFLFGTRYVSGAAFFDLLFLLALSVAVVTPIVRARQWRQIAIVAKLLFLGVGQTLFYLGALGLMVDGVRWGVYGGLYLVISLIMTVGARVLPSFIENGLEGEVKVFNPFWINIVSLILYLLFFVFEVFFEPARVSAYAAGALFVITTIRLFGWHAPGIWRKPLLWSLFASFMFIDAGFLLFALSPICGFSKLIAVHAMTVGGIGLITMGMMSRVSLGHSGRSIQRPPVFARYSFLSLAAGGLVRVLFPMVWAQNYVAWIALAQVFWILAFLLFVVSYAPILVGPDISDDSTL